MDKRAKTPVWLFPGRNMTLKRYKPYFPSLELMIEDPTHEAVVILCHSRGIDAALEAKSDLPIVALDPTTFSTDSRVVSWTHEGRQGEVPEGAQIVIYTPSTHHPYMVKAVRDKILRHIQSIK
jgi:hypothetical protein